MSSCRNPDMEKDEHRAGELGVIEEEANESILNELAVEHEFNLMRNIL